MGIDEATKNKFTMNHVSSASTQNSVFKLESVSELVLKRKTVADDDLKKPRPEMSSAEWSQAWSIGEHPEEKSTIDSGIPVAEEKYSIPPVARVVRIDCKDFAAKKQTDEPTFTDISNPHPTKASNDDSMCASGMIIEESKVDGEESNRTKATAATTTEAQDKSYCVHNNNKRKRNEDPTKAISDARILSSLPAIKKRNVSDSREITEDDHGSSSTKKSLTPNESKNLAPSLDKYLAVGGCDNFLPRPEWLNPTLLRDRHNMRILLSEVEQERTMLNDEITAVTSNYGSIHNDGVDATLRDDANAQPLRRNWGNSQLHDPHPGAYNEGKPLSTFGEEYETALHVAIRKECTAAALELIRLGASMHAENTKRVTPLVLASQKGNFVVVESLLSKGANPLASTAAGSTALLQASHFGYRNIVKILLRYGANIETANFKSTTPLMRAAQEGQVDVVRLLLQKGARVNRRNKEQMSALMLASQRGHHVIVQLLLNHDADVDAMTAQNSTSLMLACKRRKFDVVRVLLTTGCEMFMKDSRGRTARHVTIRQLRTARDDATRLESNELLKLLEPTKQIEFMQRKLRVRRNYTMIKMWTLLQQERARLPCSPTNQYQSIHQMSSSSEKIFPLSDTALLHTMTLPVPLVRSIASFMPLPRLWDERLMLITKRCSVDADAAISCAFDLIDEVLEEGGFLEACGMANISAPAPFNSWEEWRSWGAAHNHLDTVSPPSSRVNALTASLPAMQYLHMGMDDHNVVGMAPAAPMNSRDLRRSVCFLQILTHRSASLPKILTMAPFKMPPYIVNQLINVNDIQSISRRLGTKAAHFEVTVAIELVMLASTVISWYNREMKD